MSKGPGRVERAIRELIEKTLGRSQGRGFTLSTEHVCRVAFGNGPWSPAQTVSALRALRRIIAKEQGWTSRFVKRWDGRHVSGQERRFDWQPPPEPPKPKEKAARPERMNELIWAYSFDGQLIWRRATITSRGGSNPDRVTIECDGRKWQCYDLPSGISKRRRRWDAPNFCRDSERPEIERRYRKIPDREVPGVSDEGVALAMLGLSRPFTTADVQRAYRTKSLKVHPDKGGDHDIMIALGQARDAALRVAR